MAGDKTPDYDCGINAGRLLLSKKGAADKTNNTNFRLKIHYTNEIGQDLEKFKNSDVGKYYRFTEMKDLNIL